MLGILSVPRSFRLQELRGSVTVAIKYWERGFNSGHIQQFILTSIILLGIPSAPTSFSLRELRGSVAIFYWERGFNGGHKQHFFLQLRSDTESNWSNRTIVEEHDMNSNLGNTSYIANISGLNPGTYRVRLIAVNSIGAADPVLLGTTFTIPTKGNFILFD